MYNALYLGGLGCKCEKDAIGVFGNLQIKGEKSIETGQKWKYWRLEGGRADAWIHWNICSRNRPLRSHQGRGAALTLPLGPWLEEDWSVRVDSLLDWEETTHLPERHVKATGRK